MQALFFFLAGLPAAAMLDRAIAVLGRPQPDDSDEGGGGESGTAQALHARPAALEVRPLPWQVEPWRTLVRRLVAAAAPPLLAVAGGRFGLAEAMGVSAFVLALLLCTGTDLVEYRVPNVVTYPGIALALAASLSFPRGDPAGALLATVVAGAVFLVMAVVTRGGLGLGDVKLAMLIGAGLGFPGAYQALVGGVMVGGACILVLFLVGVVSRRQAVPYAPFLALAAVAVALTRGTAFAPL
jgi:prepilin signal peptidase PulO-like enzyme (type II secretory pathway)